MKRGKEILMKMCMVNKLKSGFKELLNQKNNKKKLQFSHAMLKDHLKQVKAPDGSFE